MAPFDFTLTASKFLSSLGTNNESDQVRAEKHAEKPRALNPQNSEISLPSKNQRWPTATAFKPPIITVQQERMQLN